LGPDFEEEAPHRNAGLLFSWRGKSPLIPFFKGGTLSLPFIKGDLEGFYNGAF
jgi:hypothetical protein